MPYGADLQKTWRPLLGSLRAFGKAMMTLEPRKQFKASCYLVLQLYWAIIKTVFFSVKKLAGKYP